jgi:hypothetical protein
MSSYPDPSHFQIETFAAYRQALEQYKAAYKILHGIELTSVSMKPELFEAFLKEVLAPTVGISIVTNTFEVGGIAILKGT